jgi:FKBP-type peptidyl-prolyl cis-trans isomerase
MRILILAALVSISIATLTRAQQAGQAQPAPPELKTTQQKASYGIGTSIGANLRRQGFDLDVALFLRGLTDALKGIKPALPEQELREAIQTAQQESMRNLAEGNKQTGQAFLAENKKKAGVVTLPSGLQYEVLDPKDAGASPKATDTVTVHYKGTLLDGRVFDSSYDRKEPATFALNQVIPGWTEALQRMKVKEKWRLFIPSELAYGERPPGGEIGPNSVLVFEVELLSIGPAK